MTLQEAQKNIYEMVIYNNLIVKLLDCKMLTLTYGIATINYRGVLTNVPLSQIKLVDRKE